MKKLATLLFILVAAVLLVACNGETTSENARVLISNIDENTMDIEFKLELRDPDDELDSNDVRIELESEDGDVLTQDDVTLKVEGLVLITFEDLERETEYTLTVYGQIDSKDVQLYSNESSPFETLAQGETEEDPLPVATVDDFLEMEHDLYYEQAQDIDFNGVSMASLYRSGYPLTGGYDGAGYTISNIAITDATDVNLSYVSIFGVASSGYIRNLTLDNVTINNSEQLYRGPQYVGLLVSKVSNNAFEADNITITNSSITLEHNKENSTTNRNLYVGLLGGSLQGQISNVTIKDSNLNVTSYSTNGSYDDQNAATAGTYVGGAIGMIEQDKGFQIANIAVIDTNITAIVTQDVPAIGIGNYYLGGIIGAYRSDKPLTGLYTNATINFEHDTFEDTESDKLDIVYIGGLIGYLQKANLYDAYFDGTMYAEFAESVKKVNAGLITGFAVKASERIVAGGSFTLSTVSGTQTSVVAKPFAYQNLSGTWNPENVVYVTNDAAMTYDSNSVDLSAYALYTSPADVFTSEWLIDLLTQ